MLQRSYTTLQGSWQEYVERMGCDRISQNSTRFSLMEKTLMKPSFTKQHHHEMFLRHNHAGVKIFDCCILVTYICPSEVFGNVHNHKMISYFSNADLQWNEPILYFS
jgi:hypothetical protein